MCKELIIKEFIEKSDMFGFHIEKIGNDYVLKTKCDYCGRRFEKVLELKIIDNEVYAGLENICGRCDDYLSFSDYVNLIEKIKYSENIDEYDVEKMFERYVKYCESNNLDYGFSDLKFN